MELEVYTIGHWVNPYSCAREYFWMRSDSKVEARDKFKLAMKRGQPKTFIDWAVGTCKHYTDMNKFIAACEKVNLHPNL